MPYIQLQPLENHQLGKTQTKHLSFFLFNLKSYILHYPGHSQDKRRFWRQKVYSRFLSARGVFPLWHNLNMLPTLSKLTKHQAVGSRTLVRTDISSNQQKVELLSVQTQVLQLFGNFCLTQPPRKWSLNIQVSNYPPPHTASEHGHKFSKIVGKK